MKQQSRRRKVKPSEEQQVIRMYKNIHETKRIYQRWIAGTEIGVSTSAGGVIALTTLANAALVSSAPDFASLAVLYTTYRCKAIRVDIFPVYDVSGSWTGAAFQTLPSCVCVFPSFANTVATTFQQALDVSGMKLIKGNERATVMTSYRGDPDAHLWTGTGAAIGSNEQFLFSMVGTAATSTASLAIYKVVPQYLVEFRITG